MTMSIELRFKPTNPTERQAALDALNAVEASLKESLAAAGQSSISYFPVQEVQTASQHTQISPTVTLPYSYSCVELSSQFGIHINDTPACVDASATAPCDQSGGTD